MRKPLVIFGAGDIAQLAHHYFSTDSDYTVVAFTADAEYMAGTEFCGLPLIPFDAVADQYPTATHEMFVALSYAKLNSVRKAKYLAAKALGYSLATYISTRATVECRDKIGDNCFIFEDNTLQPFVSIGNNVVLWSGNHIGHHSEIEDHCFIASHVVVSGRVRIGEQCFIGVNATLRDNISIGSRCIIGAGALILKDADPEGLYIGTASERARIPSSRISKI